MFTRTFTHKEFLEYRRKEIYKRNLIVFSIATILYLNPVSVKADDFGFFDTISNLGDKIIFSLQKGGYYVIAIIAISDILRRGVVKKDKGSIPNLIITYLLIYVVVLLFPSLMKLIGEMVK